MDKGKNKAMSIIVIVCIIVAIAAIAFFKNMQDGTVSQLSDIQESSTGSVTDAAEVASDDFALVSSSLDLDALKTYDLPIIIDFGADECSACKEMAPVLEKFNSEMQGQAIIKFVDVWKYPDAVKDYPVQLIPTQVLFDAQGNPYTPSADIGIEFTLYSDKSTNEHILTMHQGGLTEEQMRLILADMGVA